MTDAVHLAHCYQGEYEGSCKYGDADCPAHFVLPSVVRQVAEDSAFFTDPDCPFKANYSAGDGRVVVIVGENASGKSLLFRCVAASLHEKKILPITISIRERTGAGTYEMSGMRRMFMYGDEIEQSTGATSANVVKNGFHNAGREGPGVLMLDEPELGLSDGYARALGEMIGQTARVGLRDACQGVVVVSHNRGLVAGIRSGLQASPAFVCMGDQPHSMLDWLAWPERRSIADLVDLSDIAGARRKTTHRLLTKIKESKNA